MFYCVDKTTGKRTSLTTTDRDEAQQIIEARNNSERQPHPESANCKGVSGQHRQRHCHPHLAAGD
jgi:hypothetical protein